MARGISLRTFEPGDAAAVHRWFNSPGATANLLEHRDEFTEADAEAWVERAMKTMAPTASGPWSSRGSTTRSASPPSTASTGTRRPSSARSWATTASAGMGVGREAERLTNKKAYEEFGAHKVYGRIPAPNEAAKKAVIYNGWTQEGVLRNHIRHEGELIDVELWGGFPEDQPPEPED